MQKRLSFFILSLTTLFQLCDSMQNFSQMTLIAAKQTLISAINQGNWDIVKDLLIARSDFDDSFLGDVLKDASKNKKWDMVNYILLLRPGIDKLWLEAVLEKAAGQGKWDMVKLLLTTRPDIYEYAIGNALNKAAQAGEWDMVEYILAKFDMDGLYLSWVLIEAAENKKWNIVKSLFNIEDNRKKKWNFGGFFSEKKSDIDKEWVVQALLHAARQGNIDFIRFVLERQYTINSSSIFWILYHAFENKYWDVIKFILEKRSDLDKGLVGLVLEEAAKYEKWDIVKLVIEKKPDLDSKFFVFVLRVAIVKEYEDIVFAILEKQPRLDKRVMGIVLQCMLNEKKWKMVYWLLGRKFDIDNVFLGDAFKCAAEQHYWGIVKNILTNYSAMPSESIEFVLVKAAKEEMLSDVLGWAIANSATKVVEVLFETQDKNIKQARKKLTINDSLYLLKIATEYKNNKIIPAILQHVKITNKQKEEFKQFANIVNNKEAWRLLINWAVAKYEIKKIFGSDTEQDDLTKEILSFVPGNEFK